jgi:hypothetical protein
MLLVEDGEEIDSLFVGYYLSNTDPKLHQAPERMN